MPRNEMRYETIPAQPGWFVFDWEGSPTEYKVRKTPIVAWLVKTHFYPAEVWDPKNKSTVLIKDAEDFSSTAYPVSTGMDYDDRGLAVLCPDHSVIRLVDGECWPDIKSYIQFACDRIEARVEA